MTLSRPKYCTEDDCIENSTKSKAVEQIIAVKIWFIGLFIKI